MALAAVTYTFAPSTLIESAEVNTNLQDLVTFLNNQTMHRDASGAFTAVPSGPAADPVSANQLPRKAYVDERFFGAHRCRLLRSTTQTINQGSATVIDFTSAPEDPESMADLGNNAITVNRTGLWLVHAETRYNTQNPGVGAHARTHPTVNGTTASNHRGGVYFTNNNNILPLFTNDTWFLDLSSGDLVRAEAFVSGLFTNQSLASARLEAIFVGG